MSSKIHALKNRPDVVPHVREAFTTWELLMAEMKLAGLYPEARTEIRVFLSWLFDKCAGNDDDLEYLESTVITDHDVIDWETSVAA